MPIYCIWDGAAHRDGTAHGTTCGQPLPKDPGPVAPDPPSAVFPAYHDKFGNAMQEPWGEPVRFIVRPWEAVMEDVKREPGYSHYFPCPRMQHNSVTEVRISAMTGGSSSRQTVALRLQLVDGSNRDRVSTDLLVFSDLDAGSRAITELREALRRYGRLHVIKWRDER